MGWKNVKKHYNLEHHVQVNEKGICIGSLYIADLIVIDMKGQLIKRYEGENRSLMTFQQKMDADTNTLAELVIAEDAFDASLEVYTFEAGKIITKLCEMPGWPNVTHDGKMMFDNTFSTDKLQVVEWAKVDAQAEIVWARRSLDRLRSEIKAQEEMLLAFESSLSVLNNDFPPNPATDPKSNEEQGRVHE